MKPAELCYWMQGRFELEDEGNPWTTFTPTQVTTLKKHLQLVGVFMETAPSNAETLSGLGFCRYLLGVLDNVDAGKGLGKAAVKKIRKQLNNEFEHVIDHLYPNQEELNKIHNGDNPFSHIPPGKRC